MCLIVLGYDMHSRYRLILAANRDEFYSRPTAASGKKSHGNLTRDFLISNDSPENYLRKIGIKKKDFPPLICSSGKTGRQD